MNARQLGIFCNVKNTAMETPLGAGAAEAGAAAFVAPAVVAQPQALLIPDSADPAANAAAWTPIVDFLALLIPAERRRLCSVIHARANSLRPLGLQPTPMHSMYTAGDGGADVFAGVSATTVAFWASVLRPAAGALAQPSLLMTLNNNTASAVPADCEYSNPLVCRCRRSSPTLACMCGPASPAVQAGQW